jgi:hypothetical protein
VAVVWISFRIANKTINGQSYQDRLDALNDIVMVSATTYWDVTTSFYAIETPSSAAQIAANVKAALEPSADIALVRAMDTKDAYIVGANNDDDIFALIPYLKKL